MSGASPVRAAARAVYGEPAPFMSVDGTRYQSCVDGAGRQALCSAER